MADKVIVLDTSILIDYYRKSDKANSTWVALIRKGYRFAISTITKYEIYTGATQSQLVFWDDVLLSITVIPFDEKCVDTAVSINATLKRKRKQIDLADLFIASTAVSQGMSFARLNKKHFDRIYELMLVDC